jgi:threonine/homoserine/homoserine lactone efflux protein
MQTSLITGVILGLAAGLAPGPLLTLTLSQSLKYGIKEGVKVAIAPVITDMPIIALALFVVYRLKTFDVFLGVLSMAGGLYILYLAFENFFSKPPDTEEERSAPRSIIKAVVVNALNPHPYLFWITVGGPLILKQGRQSLLPAFMFIAGFYFCLVGSKICLAGIAGRFRQFLASRHYIYIVRFLGAVLCLFAALLIKDALVFFGVLSSGA